MNVGLVTSSIVGGILLLSIISYNVFIQEKGSESTLTSVVKTQADDIGQLLSSDLTRIGYLNSNGVNFTGMDQQNLIIHGDFIDNDGVGVSTVQWQWSTSIGNQVTSTNPNDFYLTRTGPNGSNPNATMTFPVSHFQVRYYQGTSSLDSAIMVSNITSVEVEFIVESEEPYGTNASGDNLYARSFWKRRLFLTNILEYQ
ncbi:MAG: hypothetical protein AAFW89_07970 [Bacteroidota bacterium]